MLQAITDYIRSGESFDKNLGLEIEHFVVNKDGDQIGFEEISNLIFEVANRLGAQIHYMDGYPVGYFNGRYATSLEPACQFEISISPYAGINEIKDVYQEFRTLWDPILKERGYHMETGGNLAKVESGEIKPDDIPLSPKSRYKYMNRYFESTGKYGKYMMRASASTQISVDYSSEEDLVKKLRVLQKISPVFMIMMENKNVADSILEDATKKHLLRIQEWDNLDTERTGYLRGSLDEDFGYEKMAEIIYKTPLILLTDNGETIDVGHLSAEELVGSRVIEKDTLDREHRSRLIEHFMSMGFFHFRVKKYIEIRVADSVPIEKALGYSALIKGLIYHQQTLDYLDRILQDVATIQEINGAVEEIERSGFDAVIYHGKTAGEWADELKTLASKNLWEEEEEYLNYV